MIEPSKGSERASSIRTTPAILQHAAREFADTEAVVTESVRWTFAELEARCAQAGRAFVRAGVAPGDRVAIWAPNVPEWIVAQFGAHLAGAVVVPMNTRFKRDEAVDIVARSGARVVCCVHDFVGNEYVDSLVEAADAGDLSGVERIVVLQGPTPAVAETNVRFESWADFLASGDDPSVPLPDVGEEDLSDIIYTSGTTGRPKGVMATHAQTIEVFTVWSDIVGLRHGDRYLIVNPFFHTFGYKAGILACTIRGATMVPEPIFDVPTVLRRVAEEAISALPGPPTLFLSILDHPDRDSFDLSSLRLAVTGAAVVPVEMIKRMRSELTFATILTAYGLTESTGTVTMCRAEDSAETISRTSGRAIPDVEVRIFDDADQELPTGESGEIVVRGYNVMHGYLDDPAATSEAIDADGWLHTGDIGVMDADGNVTITDRKKDMMIVGGFNAYPAEIENTLHEHEAIAQCAVVGMADDRLGEVGHAFIVPRSGATVDADEVISWCRERMANYKVPRAVHVVDALPMNASGKVLKFELRATGH